LPASATDLLSREPVESSRSRAPGLRPCDRRFQPGLSAARSRNLETKHLPRWRWMAVAGISSPEWRRGWSRITNFEHHHLIPEGCPTARGLPDISSPRPCQPSTSQVLCSMTPLLTSRSETTETVPSRIARTSSWCRAPSLHPSKARGAFHRQVPPLHPLLTLGASLCGPPLVSRLGHRRPSFRHAFADHVGPLDPRTYRLFAGALRPHAAHRLLQRNRSPSTPSNRPIPRVGCDGEPPRGEVACPLTRTANRAFPGQGPPNESDEPPPRRPLVTMALPQPVRLEHLLSRARASHNLETSSVGRPCGTLVRTSSPNGPRRSTTHLEGPPSAPARESEYF